MSVATFLTSCSIGANTNLRFLAPVCPFPPLPDSSVVQGLFTLSESLWDSWGGGVRKEFWSPDSQPCGTQTGDGVEGRVEGKGVIGKLVLG